MEFKETILQVKQDARDAGIEPSDDKILEVAEKIYLSGKIQEHKSSNIDRMAGQKQVQNPHKPKQDSNPNEPATDKQKNYLKNKGYNFPPNITKKEAHKIISEIMSGKDKEEI